MKHENSIRLFCVNPRGFGPDTHEKIMMLKQSKQRLQFDGAFFSSPDRSLNSRRIELLRKKVLNIGRNIKINASDAKIATQGVG